MINIATETLLTLPDAARRIPPSRPRRPTHPATVWRLIPNPESSKGFISEAGPPRPSTRSSAMSERETLAVLGTEPATTGRMSPVRRRQLELAEREAASMGI